MTYLGAKDGSGQKERIIAAMTPHDTYIELFLGTGAVMRAKPRSRRSIGVEANLETLATYKHPSDIDVIAGDVFTFLDSFDFSAAGRVLIYADPPYIQSLRNMTNNYGEHELTDAQHEQLCAALSRLSLLPNVEVMLSGYPSDLYDEHLKGFNELQYQIMTRGGPRTESLWTSFVIGEAVHWHTYAGKNKDERQRIKRKAERMARKYEAMPSGERLAVMSAMLRVDALQRS